MKLHTPTCIRCKTSSVIEVNDESVDAYRKGALIQEAFPELTPEQRELLVSGTHPECWIEIFGDGE